jgi:hypothetical protein
MIMEESELIDDAFYVQEKTWGTWQSHYKDGNGIITSLTKDECVRSTRWYLKQKQENALESIGTKYGGVVEGKL